MGSHTLWDCLTPQVKISRNHSFDNVILSLLSFRVCARTALQVKRTTTGCDHSATLRPTSSSCVSLSCPLPRLRTFERRWAQSFSQFVGMSLTLKVTQIPLSAAYHEYHKFLIYVEISCRDNCHTPLVVLKGPNIWKWCPSYTTSIVLLFIQNLHWLLFSYLWPCLPAVGARDFPPLPADAFPAGGDPGGSERWQQHFGETGQEQTASPDVRERRETGSGAQGRQICGVLSSHTGTQQDLGLENKVN